MKHKIKSSPDHMKQSERFIEVAREIGADDDEATFKAKLGRITKAKPSVPKAK